MAIDSHALTSEESILATFGSLANLNTHAYKLSSDRNSPLCDVTHCDTMRTMEDWYVTSSLGDVLKLREENEWMKE